LGGGGDGGVTVAGSSHAANSASADGAVLLEALVVTSTPSSANQRLAGLIGIARCNDACVAVFGVREGAAAASVKKESNASSNGEDGAVVGVVVEKLLTAP
jgi:hypothetical protein